MDHHGVDMKGKYYLETKTATQDNTNGLSLSIDQRRLIINASDDKMYFCNFSGGGGSGKWIRHIIANDDDVPDQDDVHTLGGSSAKWAAIYATDFEGTARLARYG